MGTSKTSHVCSNPWCTKGKTECTQDELQRVLDQLRECLVAIRAEFSAEMEEPDYRRVKPVQESILKKVENLEGEVVGLRASVYTDRHTNTKVVSRFVVPNRNSGPGSAVREIDDYIQNKLLRSRPNGSSDKDGVELEIKAPSKGKD